MINANIAFASTVFCLERDDELLVAKSTGWVSSHCYLMVNKRGVSKRAFLNGFGKKAQWISKYGSVTFNQVSQDLPSGGMNEMGLVIEVTSNRKITSQDSDKPKINEIQWVQYNLDMYQNVGEVISGLNSISIKQSGKGLVYFLCDRSGNKAAIEIVDGIPQVYRDDTLPIAAITNTLLDKALLISEHPELYRIDNPQSSVNRFLTSKAIIDEFGTSDGESTAYCFESLNRVKQDITMFEIVYDVKRMMIYFRSKDSPEIKQINVENIAYSCENEDIAFEINSKCVDDVSCCLKPYDLDQNVKLANTAYESLVKDGSLKGPYKYWVKLFYINKLGRYPSTLKCL